MTPRRRISGRSYGEPIPRLEPVRRRHWWERFTIDTRERRRGRGLRRGA